MPRLEITPYQEHKYKWKDGCGSDQCARATKCFSRGQLPCDLLFVGEAPGVNENACGSPFVGPAGILLDSEDKYNPGMIQRALRMVPREIPIRMCFGNLVLCIPRDEDGSKTEEPSPEQIECCRPRLEEFIRIAQPRVVVAVGKLAQGYLEVHRSNKWSVKVPDGTSIVHIIHPAYILRASSAQRGLLEQRCVVTLATTMRGLR